MKRTKFLKLQEAKGKRYFEPMEFHLALIRKKCSLGSVSSWTRFTKQWNEE